MSSDRIVAFTDNWAYLRVELNWLDRLLRLAVARQRQETKEVERVAKTKADRVTSHWWKGLIYLDGKQGHDEHSPVSMPLVGVSPPNLNYQQQLEAKIQASYRQGVCLGLPQLCDRLKLTLFEKNLMLMSLAPEINRRYARLYGFLQDEEHADLPNVDLILRLLCRGDAQWREARASLTTDAPLIRLGLVELPSLHPSDTFLLRRVKLADRLVDYLLATEPTLARLDQLLGVSFPCIHSELPNVPWSALILPTQGLAQLQYFQQQWEVRSQLHHPWGFTHSHTLPGQLGLLVGATGTGKTLSAQALATAINLPLVWLDLATVEAETLPQVLAHLIERSPELLLIKSAGLGLGRHPRISEAQMQQFLRDRQQQPSITLFSVTGKAQVKPSFLEQFDQVLELPMPTVQHRVQLWQQAFPAQVPLDPNLAWEKLAKRWTLTGGEIVAIAYKAAVYAAGAKEMVRMEHLVTAWQHTNGQMLKRYRR